MMKLLQPLCQICPALAIGAMTCFLTTHVLANPTPITEENITPFVPSQGNSDDLKGVTSPVEFSENFAPESPYLSSSEFLVDQPDNNDNNNSTKPQSDGSALVLSEAEGTLTNRRWRINFQPYVTIPLSTYGSVTVRGRSANYSLSLGELLDNLRVTASGRVEAWNGRWGFIMDGYYTSLQGVVSAERSRTRIPGTINALDYLFGTAANTQLTQLTNTLQEDINNAKEVEELRESELLQSLEQQVQNFQDILAQDAEDLNTLKLNVQEFRESLAQDGQKLESLDFSQIKLENSEINPQDFRDILSLNLQDLPRTQDPQELNAKIQQLGQLPDLGQLEQELIQTREILQQAEERVRELRAEKDSEELQQLETQIQETTALVDQEIDKLNQIQDFQENRLPQEFNGDITSNINFDQGIYDFAVSYHIGPLPQMELPEKPSTRGYPLVWFQPILGVRLNQLSLTLQETLNIELSSSLVNFTGTFENTYTQGRTWFEPMLGGKFGVQVSDPLIFWVRGDVSGFGLAGETDLSWNLLFGGDWWVNRRVSLQLAYRFYSIDYQNGTGNNAFGFEQNLNGPYLSATFHF